MSVIWPGLEVLIQSYVCHHEKKPVQYQYPFVLLPPDPGFDRGTFRRDWMERVLALYTRLHSKRQTGGRVQLDAVQIRAAIFAIRTTLGHTRMRKHYLRKLKPRAKSVLRVDQKSIETMKRRAHRAIASLERYMKRANRQLRTASGDEAYTWLMGTWGLHLRWMRLHLAYFKPLPSVLGRRKSRYQQILDEFVDIALHGLSSEGVEPPEPAELRRLMRMLVRSSRRARESFWTVAYIQKYSRTFNTRRYVAQWVLDRIRPKKTR